MFATVVRMFEKGELEDVTYVIIVFGFIFLVCSIVAAISSLLVRSTEMICDSGDVIKGGEGITNAFRNHVALKRLKKLTSTVAKSWLEASTSVHKVNNKKAFFMGMAQWMLLVGVIITVIGIIDIMRLLS